MSDSVLEIHEAYCRYLSCRTLLAYNYRIIDPWMEFLALRKHVDHHVDASTQAPHVHTFTAQNILYRTSLSPSECIAALNDDRTVSPTRV